MHAYWGPGRHTFSFIGIEHDVGVNNNFYLENCYFVSAYKTIAMIIHMHKVISDNKIV